MIVCVVTTASLGWVPNSCQDHQFRFFDSIGFTSKYLTIRDRNCNCQKISHLALSSLIIIIIIIIILLHILVSSYLGHIIPSWLYLILVTSILSYLLVLDHLMLRPNKSHNILEKTLEVTIKLLCLVQMMDEKSCVALFE